MTWTSTLALSALWFGAGAAAAWRFTMLHYRSRLSEATSLAATYKAWWERDSAKMLIAQAENDLTREQRRMAGRQSHKAERELFRATAEKLRQCVAEREIQPTAADPAMGFPADLSAGRSTSETGGRATRSSGQDTGRGHPPHVTQRVKAGNEPGRSCRRNRAGDFVPAETTLKAKGAI